MAEPACPSLNLWSHTTPFDAYFTATRFNPNCRDYIPQPDASCTRAMPSIATPSPPPARLSKHQLIEALAQELQRERAKNAGLEKMLNEVEALVRAGLGEIRSVVCPRLTVANRRALSVVQGAEAAGEVGKEEERLIERCVTIASF